MLNSSHNSEKVSSSSKKRRQLLRQLLRLRKLRKWTSSASLADWLYLLSLCFIALFLVSIILGVILLSYTWTTVTIFFICGLCVTLGYWKVLSSRKKRRWLRRQFFRLRKWTSSATLANWPGLLVFCLDSLVGTGCYPSSVVLCELYCPTVLFLRFAAHRNAFKRNIFGSA